MDIAFCYESVLPAKGGCETYIGDLARRLSEDGHHIHLYACRWDETSLPESMIYHRLQIPKGPRFLRPWRFGWAVEKALQSAKHDVTIGFDKTWGQDILYPQGGLHRASAFHNRNKFASTFSRSMATLLKWFDPASWSFARLERKQYLGQRQPIIIVNSHMVRRHFWEFYQIPAEKLRVIHSAINPDRFQIPNRVEIRQHIREQLHISADTPLALFVAMNYRLKGLAPLLRALPLLPKEFPFQVLVVGHPKFQKYATLAKELGIFERVQFLGYQPKPKDYYYAADFLIHPTFYDPCSLVALEALACGMPVLTTQYNGAKELFEECQGGVIVENPHDSLEMATAIQKMLEPKFQRQAIVAATEAGQRWTFERHYQAMLCVFEEVAQKKLSAL